MTGAELYVGILSLVVGPLILGVWAVLLARRQVPEVNRGERGIWFHITAETIAAALLVAGGVSLLVSDAGWSRVLAGVALGALLYTTVNSAGHYADQGQRPVVAMFAVLAVLAGGGIVVLLVA